jgi:hypothetical protein
MGFPSVDKIIVDYLTVFFDSLRSMKTSSFIVDDVFSDRSPEERAAVRDWLASREVMSDIRGEIPENPILIINGYPIAQPLLPQIAVSIGTEANSDFALGEVTDLDAQQEDAVGQEGGEQEKIVYNYGNWITGTWNITIAARHWHEIDWVSRLTQRGMREVIKMLYLFSIAEPRLSMADLQPDAQAYPDIAYARQIVFSGKLENTWAEREDLPDIQTGVNTALEGEQ